jgi:hypothetical protein
MDDRGQNEVNSIEETAKTDNDCHGLPGTELQEKAKDSTELAEHLETAKHVIERYSETFQRLADS